MKLQRLYLVIGNISFLFNTIDIVRFTYTAVNFMPTKKTLHEDTNTDMAIESFVLQVNVSIAFIDHIRVGFQKNLSFQRINLSLHWVVVLPKN